MFQSEELDNHLKTSHTIQTESAVYAEWNLNDLDNIERLGNYRYRPSVTGDQFSLLPATYDPLDEGGFYTGATQADVTIQAGFDDEDNPTLFTQPNKKMELLYSLEECIKPHRPRSGINKLLYLGEQANQYLDIGNKGTSVQENINISRRPRYYMSSRYDQFKYWTSYRTEEVNGEQQEFGISQESDTNTFYIDDACPFIIYREEIPTNRITIKMQTNVGDIDLGPIRDGDDEIPDPFFGFSNQTTPRKWRIEVLRGSSWVEAISFDENSTDFEGNPIIKSDGHVEISYGLFLPQQFRSSFVYVGEISDESLLPENAPIGYTYLLKTSEEDIGVLKYFDGEWISINPEYRWDLSSDEISNYSKFVTQSNNPYYFRNRDNQIQFREIDFIRGIRVVVETMNIPQATFDLIEISPRIVADISEKTFSINIAKTMSDLGNGSIPVGNIQAAVGSIDILDEDFSFNPNNPFDKETNTGSILAKYVDIRTKYKFYQIVRNVNGFDYFVPIKTMYSDGIPTVTSSTAQVSVELRDLFFLLESFPAPELLITDVSISYAVTLLLDYMGFSNIVFKRIENVPEIIIPYFFVAPDQNVAEVLQQLAVASQTSMFFDEYNNFVIMSKEYLLPEEGQREIDSTLLGQQEGENLPNIINLSSEEKRVYNEGRLNYTSRYIQRAISEYRQAPYSDKFKTYGYKPSLLWEVTGREQLRSQNELPQQSQGFSLSAAPLNSDLTEDVPFVLNRNVINNVLDVGEHADTIASYQGYLYSGGEIIKYDAIEYAITGPTDDNENVVWVKSNLEYQDYFSRLPFNGKMYPTGNLRIFAEPEFEVINGETFIKNGPVKNHGRGQFGTPVVSHQAGLDPYWSDNNNVAGCLQQTQDYLFNTSEIINYPDLSQGPAGKIYENISGVPFFSSDEFAKSSTRNGIIKNNRANKYYTENEVNYFDTARVGTLQSSALVFNGPSVPEQIRTADFVSYVYKELDGPYKHFGTRMRIIGKIESTNQKSQTPFGAFPIYATQDLNIDDPSKNIQILGGAGGLAFNLNKETNNGYYFEIVSLTQDNVDSYTGSNREKTVVYDISNVSCTNNVVTARSKTNVDFVVGQKIIIQGLTDQSFPTNTSTPLNGEYVVTAINADKKRFQYTITPPTKNTLTILGAKASENSIRYYFNRGDSRQTIIKPGDKINITGLSNSQFNGNGLIVRSVVKSDEISAFNAGWYFVVDKKASGELFLQNGTATYVPLTTTSKNNGSVIIPEAGENSIANVYFYKILADEKREKITAYSVNSNEITLFFEEAALPLRYKPGEIIVIDSNFPENTSKEYIVGSVSNNTVRVRGGAQNKNKTNIAGEVYLKNSIAVPYKLWSGLANILTDDGKFTGQYRFVGEENSTVYDLAAEYITVGNARRFFLYINNKQVATVTDPDPLPEYKNMALFVRGSSRCMFENIYAIGGNVSQNSKIPVATPISKVFGDEEIDSSESLRKYAISGFIQKTYLSSIGSEEPPAYLLYFDEFGSIMREAAYFNIKYDRAYPALYARIMKTLNKLKGYAVSGFYAGSYGADFLIFNCQDTNINLDDTTGNFLRIQGITFTQNTTQTLTVDDFYKKLGSFSDPISNFDGTLTSPLVAREEYNRILNSRNKYGINEFTIESDYIQTNDAAENVFGWTLDKITKPKIVVGLNTFSTFNIQLGDLLNINYKNNDGLDVVAETSKNFIVYNIEYTKDINGENITMYLAEA